MESVADLRKFDIQALQDKVKAAKADLNKLSVVHVLDPIKNPRRITKQRRHIARLLTLVFEKKI